MIIFHKCSITFYLQLLDTLSSTSRSRFSRDWKNTSVLDRLIQGFGLHSSARLRGRSPMAEYGLLFAPFSLTESSPVVSSITGLPSASLPEERFSQSSEGTDLLCRRSTTQDSTFPGLLTKYKNQGFTEKSIKLKGSDGE